MNKITLAEAMSLHMSDRLQEAEMYYNQFLNKDPDNWYVIFLIATLYMQLDKNGLAIGLFRRAAELRESPEIWNNMGTAYRKEHDNEKAEICLLKSLDIRQKLRKDPPGDIPKEAVSEQEDADTFSNLGTLHINEGSPKEAEKYLRKAIAINPDHIQAHWNLGLSLLEQARWEEGFKEYEWGVKTQDRKERHRWLPFYKGGKKKSVIVYGEQGIGDEIMFASIIPDLQKDVEHVIFECHPRLINMFKRSFPGVSFEPTRKLEQIDWMDKYEPEAKLPIGNLGTIYRKQDSDFPRVPYLKPDPEKVAKYRKRMEATGPGPYIGLGWKGGAKSTRKDLRSIPLDDLKALVDIKGTYFSLQYTPEATEQVKTFHVEHSVNLHHWPEIIFSDEYDDTLAFITALDLVINVNGSVVHLAGASGNECWTLTPYRYAWRYATNNPEKMIWYDSVKQYKQETDGDWGPIIKQARKDLIKRGIQ